MKSISIIDCSDLPPDLNLLTMNVITTVNLKKESEVQLMIFSLKFLVEKFLKIFFF